MRTLTPQSPDEIAAIVAEARAARQTIRLHGHGSKRAIGRDVPADICLDLSGLSGVVLYEPEELVLSVKAGTPVADVRALLAARGQHLAFEPMDYGPLLGQAPGRGTMGGLLAANLSGPRRLSAGAARDHVLGVAGVTGRGEIFKAGGRVVKNVTGFDLARGLSGSWGTLAIVTELTLKVLPIPEAEETVVVEGLAAERATEVMAAALGSSADVSAAAFLPGDLGMGPPPSLKGGGDVRGAPVPPAFSSPLEGEVERGGTSALQSLGSSLTLLRLEGTPVSIGARRTRLLAMLRTLGPIHCLDGQASSQLWQAIRDVRPFWPDLADNAEIWRISVAPSSGTLVLRDLAEAVPGARGFLDWQGGLVWAAVPAGTPVETVRAVVARQPSGHATLIRASAERRATVAVFPPLSPGVALVSRRLKAQFDPDGLLEPGRLG